jgi:putative transposase
MARGSVRLIIVDLYARDAVTIEAGQRLKADDVVRTLNRLESSRGASKVLSSDNDSEFISQAIDLWAYWNGMKIGSSRIGKPTDTVLVESFNGRSEANV